MKVQDAPRVVIIDGRSGSGKTTLAARIAARLASPASPGAAAVPAAPVQMLHLDSLYPGWDGLAQGSEAVAAVLHAGGYHPYDWAAEQFSQTRIALDTRRPLVIEGCGALTGANLEAARSWAGGTGRPRTIWLECEQALRRQRALSRDGEMFAPHWERWAAQERAHYARHTPWLLADELIDSTAAIAPATAS